MSSNKQRWIRIALSVVAFGIIAATAFLAGPRNVMGPNTAAPRTAPPDNTDALDGWLKKSEAAYPDIKPGNAKSIIWANATKQRTPWSVVYVHGFSGGPQETAPVSELVGKGLGANVFYTRLSGHGRPGKAMTDSTPQDWMADIIEAVRVGKILGDRVLLISCSTGSTLSTWLALSPEANKVAAHVFISPNFGPKDKRSEIINGPWGKNIVMLITGDTYGWTPVDAREANAWTTSYPTQALLPMMALVKGVRESDLSLFQTPLLVLYSEGDTVVDPVETQAAFTRIGAPLKTIETVGYSKNIGQHVLAGAIKSPDGVAPMVSTILQWAKALPAESK